MTVDFGFPILSLIVFVPIVAAVIILFINKEQKDLVRGIAIAAAATVLALSLAVYVGYNNQVETITARQAELSQADGDVLGTRLFDEGLRYEEFAPWVPALGINYHVGVDGLNAPMVLLTGLVAVAGVLVSWRIEDRTREFMAFFLLLVAGVYGVFVSMDMFVLFFFYELSIFPMYLLIATWGWIKTREYAAMKLTLYILVGSVIALVGVIAMVVAANNFFTGDGAAVFQQAKSSGLLSPDATEFSFDITQLTLAGDAGAFNIPVLGDVSFAKLWFPFVFLGFGVLAGVFPFHNWSPDGHVAAPTAVSMIHAGVLMKLGAYAALRAGVQLLPDGATTHLQALRGATDRLGTPRGRWILALTEATLHRMWGEFAEADAYATTAFEIGQRYRITDAAAALSVHYFFSCFHRSSLAPLHHTLESQVSLHPEMVTWRLGAGLAAFDAGEPKAATRCLHAAMEGLSGPPLRDETWMLSLCLATELAASVDEGAELVGLIEPLLEPHSGQFVVLGGVVGEFGPTDRCLGLLAAARRDYQAAESRFRSAVAICEKLKAQPWRIRSTTDWLVTCPSRRHDPTMRTRLANEARRLGLQRTLARLQPSRSAQKRGQ